MKAVLTYYVRKSLLKYAGIVEIASDDPFVNLLFYKLYYLVFVHEI